MGTSVGAAEAEGHWWDPCRTSRGRTHSCKAPADIRPSSCPVWCTTAPHHSHPTARLGAVGAHRWAGRKAGVWADPVQPRMVAAVTAHEPAQGGCPAAGAHHCSAAPRDVEGSLWPWDHVWTVSCGHHIQVVSHGHGCPVLLVGWPSPSCNVEQGQGTGRQREETCNKAQLANAGTECSVFIGGFTPNALYKEQADSAAHADARTYCCRLPRQLSWHPGSIAQPCRARLYQTPLANAVVLPDRLCLRQCCR